MDERYLLAATRYVELNPVKCGLVKTPEAYRWSSAAAHLSGRDDELLLLSHSLKRLGIGRGFFSVEYRKKK
jgi:putative transposase